MKRFSSQHALAFGTIGVCAFGVGLGISTQACSSSTSPGNSNPGTGNSSGTCTVQTLTILPHPDAYSAYIPNSTMHTFQIPLGIKELPPTATVTWSGDSRVAFSPGSVDFGDAGAQIANAMATTMGSGDVTITATSGSQCGQVTLHITAATEDDWTIGSERYNNGTLLTRTTRGGLTAAVAQDGGMQVACTSCHGITATNSTFATVEHTPEQTGGFSDTELTGIFEMATIPVGGYFDPTIICAGRRNCDITQAEQTYATFHAWDVTPDQAKGLVVYLRSLTPAPQTGVANFMANPPRMRPEAGAPDTGTTIPTADSGPVDEASTIDAPAAADAQTSDAPASTSDATVGDAGPG